MRQLRPEVVVADLGVTFVDRMSLVPTVVARDLDPPTRIHLEAGIATMPRRLIACMEEIGVVSLHRVPVFLPLYAGIEPRATTFWYQVVQTLGGNPMVVNRPVAAAASLGLEVTGHAHLLVEGGDGVFEAAALVDGEVVASRTIRSRQGGWRTMLDSLIGLLRQLDPDDELEVRDRGVSVFGPAADDMTGLVEVAGLKVESPVGNTTTVAAGTQVIAHEAVRSLRAI